MPNNRADNTQPGAIVSAGTSPVTLNVPPHSSPVAITITSAAAITVTAQTGPGHAIDITHTP